MRGVPSIILWVSALLVTAAPVLAQNREGVVPFARLDGSLEYRSDRGGDEVFAYPLHGTLGVAYESGSVSAAVSVDVDGEGEDTSLGPGETFIRAGEEASYFKIGYFAARWGVSPGFTVVDILNRVDDDYPSNIFYVNRRQANPLFIMSFGGGTATTEFALSRRDEAAETVDDTILGIRVSTLGAKSDVSAGMIRPVGSPPPLFFLTFASGDPSARVWLELGWWSLPDTDDELDVVLGVGQDFGTASYEAEFVAESRNHFFRLYNRFPLVEFALVLESYFFLPSFSTALDAHVDIAVDEKTGFDFGGRFFFGKEGSFFSRFKEDNDNAVYFRLNSRF